ncbi:methylmalonyl-CoA mutase family protein [Streptomyces sp. NPDC059255]|uniref:methylmalonyl-CoA mutase family protein n=1 Tax=Streptomyces sp. NPDC059255 TaxID=3346793 RepID=UPI00368E709B
MRAPDQPLTLASEFPAATFEEWRGLAAATLSGDLADRDPETALSSWTEDGLRLKPLYTARDLDGLAPRGVPGRWPYVRGTDVPDASRGWEVRQRLTASGPGPLAESARAELSGGVDTLWLPTDSPALRPSDLPEVLATVDLTGVGLVLDDTPASRTTVRTLLAVAQERGIDPGALTGSLGVDPLGRQARTGVRTELVELPALFALARDLPSMAVITVDGTVHHRAGASPAEELGLATATAVTYLRALTDAGLTPEEVFARVEFRLAVTADQFGSLAKLRAARLVWSRVAELCGVPEAGAQRQHAVTSQAMLTRHDARTNMLRATVACVSAVAGGASAITVLPFDAAGATPGDLGRRVARSTHAILRHEAHLGRVSDPAGGSPYIETLTDALAEAAWEHFTAVEQSGGMQSHLDSGQLHRDLAATARRRRRAVAVGQRPLTGISSYAVLDDPLPHGHDPAPRPPGALPEVSYGEEFEALRDRSDAHVHRTGARPGVLLVAQGTPARNSRVLDSARNMFASGGIAADQTVGAVDELTTVLRERAARAVCICAADTEGLGALAAAARASGASVVYALGSTLPAEERQAGYDLDITFFGPPGGDVPARLRQVLNDLEVR